MSNQSPSDKKVDLGKMMREIGVGVGVELPWQVGKEEDLVGAGLNFFQESSPAIGVVVGPANNLAMKVKT